MNIFAYHPDPNTSALWLDDVRKNKMILESCQLLSTTVAILCPSMSDKVYKISYRNHPCAIWVRQSHANFVWLLSYVQALHSQRGRPHKSADLFPFFNLFCDVSSGNFPQTNLTPFANCARNKELGVDFTHVADVHQAYRLYSCERWRNDTIKLSWRYGIEPDWRN